MDKLDLIVDKIDNNQKHVEHRLDKIDENLFEHMRRTDVLEKLHMDNQDRIQSLEEPRKAIVFIKNAVLFIGAIAGSVYTIIKLFGE